VDENGKVSFDEFKAMFSHSSLGAFSWEGVDDDRMAKIEQFSKGVGHAHEVSALAA
jgi:hypothetical protein